MIKLKATKHANGSEGWVVRECATPDEAFGVFDDDLKIIIERTDNDEEYFRLDNLVFVRNQTNLALAEKLAGEASVWGPRVQGPDGPGHWRRVWMRHMEPSQAMQVRAQMQMQAEMEKQARAAQLLGQIGRDGRSGGPRRG